MRNEITASRLCNTRRLHEQPRSHRQQASDVGEVPLHAETMDATKNGLEPLRLRDTSRCVSRGMIHHMLEDDILSGRFAREWSDVQAKGLERIQAEALASALA